MMQRSDQEKQKPKNRSKQQYEKPSNVMLFVAVLLLIPAMLTAFVVTCTATVTVGNQFGSLYSDLFPLGILAGFFGALMVAVVLVWFAIITTSERKMK